MKYIMQNIVQAFVFLLQTALACAGVNLRLTAAQSAPSGSTLLGTTVDVQSGVAVLTVTRGSGPSLRTFWTGHWIASVS